MAYHEIVIAIRMVVAASGTRVDDAAPACRVRTAEMDASWIDTSNGEKKKNGYYRGTPPCPTHTCRYGMLGGRCMQKREEGRGWEGKESCN